MRNNAVPEGILKTDQVLREESELAWNVPIETLKETGFNLDIKTPHIEEEENTYNILGKLKKKLK
ncbi:MAG: hypothetical protein DRP58_04200 [Spirochaetes bacterium]|nr:MAG: hypothetical protein DRP58_04200 [Spirochaetota bacterium]